MILKPIFDTPSLSINIEILWHLPSNLGERSSIVTLVTESRNPKIPVQRGKKNTAYFIPQFQNPYFKKERTQNPNFPPWTPKSHWFSRPWCTGSRDADNFPLVMYIYCLAEVLRTVARLRIPIRVCLSDCLSCPEENSASTGPISVCYW